MKVGFSSKRLGTSGAECIEGDMHQSAVDQLYVRITKTCGIEMTREELQKSIVRGNDVVYVLLPFRKIWLVCRCEFLFTVERVGMP